MMPHDHETSDGRDEGEAVPAELVEVLRRLDTDGAHWRARLPRAEGVEARVRGAIATHSAAAPAPHEARAGRLLHLHAGAERTTRGRQSVTSGRVRGLAALAAVAVVIALFIALLHGVTPGQVGKQGVEPSPTKTSVGKTPTPSNGWIPLDNVTATTESDQDGPVAIAPSDPRVIYTATRPPLTLRRTDDGGATWHTLASPVAYSPDISAVQLFVSPLDARTVFAEVTVGLDPAQAATCPSIPPQGALLASTLSTRTTAAPAPARPLTSPLTRPLGGKIQCTLTYHSTDGGASWKAPDLPLPGTLLGWKVDFSPIQATVLHAQGGKLYSLIGCGPLCSGPSARIVVSADGGASWSLADGDLRAAGQNICEVAPAPSGSLVFAVTTSDVCQNQNMTGVSLALWRSDDGGAHWSRVGDLPATISEGLMAVDGGDGGKGGPLLYDDLPVVQSQGHALSVSQGPANLRASADGGKTWTQAPVTGMSAAQNAAVTPPLGTLADGSIVVGQSAGAPGGLTVLQTTLYAWKAGDTSWRQISGPLNYQLTSLLVAHSGSGSDGTLWAVAQTGAQTGQNGALTGFTYGVFRSTP
jgi:hypothetical protein